VATLFSFYNFIFKTALRPTQIATCENFLELHTAHRTPRGAPGEENVAPTEIVLERVFVSDEEAILLNELSSGTNS
jgi:hypothetical protein